jgi:hypothetical protein
MIECIWLVFKCLYNSLMNFEDGVKGRNENRQKLKIVVVQVFFVEIFQQLWSLKEWN